LISATGWRGSNSWAPGDDGHHHHLICTECTEVIEIEECFSARAGGENRGAQRLQSDHAKLEFFGICPECQGIKPQAQSSKLKSQSGSKALGPPAPNEPEANHRGVANALTG